jgi:hypothetical protein
MAAWEGDAERLRQKRRGLVDVLWEAMQRGDRVTLGGAGHSFTGKLTIARGDLAVLATHETDVAVNIGAVDLATFVRDGDGVSGDRSYRSFRAYLGMLEVEGMTVRLLGRDIDIVGRVDAVAADHVMVIGTTEATVPITRIAAVVR